MLTHLAYYMLLFKFFLTFSDTFKKAKLQYSYFFFVDLGTMGFYSNYFYLSIQVFQDMQVMHSHLP